MTVQTAITQAEIESAGATGVCSGAQVRTPVGAKNIEFLRKGDLIVTRDNGLQPVRMVWTRKVTAAEMAADPSLAPIVLRPRAIAPMMPQKELAVGGAHRLLIPGWRLLDEEDGEACLVPSRDMASPDDRAFVDRDAGDVTYYNVVFDGAEVFTCNGLPVESFRPTTETIGKVDREVRDTILATLSDMGSKPQDFPAPRYKLRERVSYSPDYA